MDFDYAFDAITPTQSTSLTINGTGSLVLPSGTTAQRPVASNGTLRYNSDTQSIDLVVGGAYQSVRGSSILAATGISAAGTTQATATPITAGVNNITTVTSASGVILPTYQPGDTFTVVNRGVVALLVYPPVGSTIGTLAVNAGYSVASNKTVSIVATTATQLEIQSDTAGSSTVSTSLTFDVTSYNVLPSNTGAVNVTSFNALYATIPVNSVILFPAGQYDFASEITLNRNVQIAIKGAGKSRSIIRTTSATANIFNVSISAYYYTFEELGFTSSITRTAGSAIIATNDNAYLDVRRCEFKNQFFGLNLGGVGSGNLGVVSECIFNAPAVGGTQVIINGSNINMMFTNCTINCLGVASIGIEINQSGAVQFVGCDFIGGTNTLKVNPTTGIISALFFTNVFFDQGSSATVLFTGTGAVSRVKFVECGITNGNVTGSIALSIAGTGVGTSIPEAIDFIMCDFYNSFGAVITTTGISITGVRGVSVINSRISGFTTGISITPYNTAGLTTFNIQGNTIGPTENFSGNSTGIQINAGAVAYGPSLLMDNNIAGNTLVNVVNNGIYTAPLQLAGNVGLSIQTLPLISTPATIAAVETIVHQISLPANNLLVGTTIKFYASGTMTGTAPTILPALRIGTAGTIADTQVCATVAAMLTTATGWQVEGFFTVRSVGSSGTAIGQIRTMGEALATSNRVSAQSTTIALNTTVANFLSLTMIGGGTKPIITVVQAHTEIVRQ